MIYTRFYDAQNHRNELEETRTKLGLEVSEFQRVLKRFERTVDAHFAKNTQDIVFKGKWYLWLLKRDMKDAFNEPGYHVDAVRERIQSSLQTSLDFSAHWADDFEKRISLVVTKLKPQN